MPKNIFAYGTLMLPEVVETLTGRLFASRKATLDGYSNYAFKDKCYPGIIEDKNGIVEGAIYSDVDDRTLSIFDWFEEGLYERHFLAVQSKGEKVQAFAYVVPQKYQYKLDSASWTLEKFIEKHAETYIQKCLGYRKQWQEYSAKFD